MYSPCLLNSRVPKVKGLASSHRLREYPREHTRRKHWKAINGEPLLLRSNTRASNHKKQHETSHVPSRAVTNSLSEVLVTHDEYRTFTVVRVVYLQVINQRLLTWQLKQAWHSTQTWQRVK